MNVINPFFLKKSVFLKKVFFFFFKKKYKVTSELLSSHIFLLHSYLGCYSSSSPCSFQPEHCILQNCYWFTRSYMVIDFFSRKQGMEYSSSLSAVYNRNCVEGFVKPGTWSMQQNKTSTKFPRKTCIILSCCKLWTSGKHKKFSNAENGYPPLRRRKEKMHLQDIILPWFLSYYKIKGKNSGIAFVMV